MQTNYSPQDSGNGHHSAKKLNTKFWIEIMTGPDPKGPTRCLHCHETFKAGEYWRRYWDPDHTYAIGLHTACIVEMEMARPTEGAGADEYGQEKAA